ncbi:hypothetical protein [Flavobacterium pectinovorum]|uniref:Uncharacterized protein n=1 Tax=Flavobacterium pectinovorum TaxID=29533 RepID=A0A502F1B7_9FLAO|nr:hypothetical protein [Flavobacterium pectinovorum]TPG44005.1 hypothetical protein EAH81_05500 [Flavobacterium pectinovorum]
MKKYQDILDAQNNFISRRNNFLELNYSFFLKLINEIYEKAELPKDGMIKYKYETNDNINFVEGWVDLDDDEICSMRISLKITEVYHDVKFYTTKVNNNIILKVVIDTFYDEFSFDMNKNEVKDLDFENIIEFIVESIISVYNQNLA